MDDANGQPLADDYVFVEGEPLVDILDDLRLRITRIESELEDSRDRRLIGEAVTILERMLIDLVKLTGVDREQFRARVERLDTIHRALGRR